MAGIESYYGVRDTKKIRRRQSNRSNRYLAMLEEDELLKQANVLFAKGNKMQCFDILQKAVTLAPNDFRPYYLLGLIHEENGNSQKSLLSYMAAAILKKNDISMWKRALSISLNTNEHGNQILALERIYRKEPSVEILLRKLEILKRLRKKYSIVACQIELFDYHGVDPKIFKRFEKTNHLNSLKKIGNCLYKCIRNNVQARTEFFLRNTIYTLYKVSDWKKILKLLDDYYFDGNDQLHPDIRFIYMTAFLYAKECRVDSLLNFSDLLNDSYAWDQMENVNYVYGLVECLKTLGEHEKSIALLEKLITLEKTSRALHVLSDIHSSIGNDSKAIGCLNQVLEIDPIEEAAKLKLHKIYEKLGYNELAEAYETPTKVVEYIKELAVPNKLDFRYSAEKCQELKMVFEKAFSRLPFDCEQFLNDCSVLVDDFFNNPFVVVKNSNFRAFSMKNERVGVENANGIVQIELDLPKKQLSDILIRISSLHGLDVAEWFSVIRYTIISEIMVDQCDIALETVKKCFNVPIFKDSNQITQILFLGVRVCLMMNDLDSLIEITRELSKKFGHSAAYFLYFISFFFPDHYLYRSFSDFQKSLQKIIRRAYTPETDECQEKNENIDSMSFLGILSFMPRFLQTDTVDFLNSTIPSSRPEIRIMKAAILISHTKSRTLSDKRKYASDAMTTLKTLEETPVVLYNIAKAYHFFGYFSHAEIYYLKVIESGPEELKRMSIFNLLLIFRDNKSRKVMEALIAKV